MFWFDEITQDILKTYPREKKFIIRDEKTLSGRIHLGSLRGVAIHGIIAQALKEKGREVEYFFEFNDFDPMDGIPLYLDQKKFQPYLGKPLCNIPSPKGKAKNYAEYFGQEFGKVIRSIGFHPKIIRASSLYQKGIYNQWIEKILTHPKEIRRIYFEVSGSKKPKDWYPFQVICEKCGKVGTTKVTDFDGKEATYVCQPDLVTWAKGCGYQGKISPYNGNGKFPWKVEWAVKWAGLAVTIEGSGKDHCTLGGSHDISARISTEILEMPVPYNIPYEFFLLGGAKMSASKGVGASAAEIAKLLPPELLRFLLIRTEPKRPLEFNPEGETIPRLYDAYDQAAQAYFEKIKGQKDLIRLFHFTQVNPQKVKKYYLPRFSRIAFILQIPRLKVEKEVQKLKGRALVEADRREIKERVKYAKLWLKDYAPEHFKFQIQEEIPEAVRTLTGDQKAFLKQIGDLLAKKDWKGEELHAEIHNLRKASPLEPKEAFSAIYLALLGKDSGPQAGWFLESLDQKFVIDRFKKIVSF